MRCALVFGLLALVAVPASVAPTASMSVPRAVHSATLLLSGEVFVAGGCAVDGCELDDRGATTELYDPDTGRFRSGPRLSRPRLGHAALRPPDGRVLIAGGWISSGPTATTEVYDPKANTIGPGARMTTARAGFAVAPLGRGRLLFTGGENGRRTVRTAEIFDAATVRFRRTADMRVARNAHTATPLRGGRVLVAGGRDERNLIVRSTEILDAGRGRFVPGPH